MSDTRDRVTCIGYLRQLYLPAVLLGRAGGGIPRRSRWPPSSPVTDGPAAMVFPARVIGPVPGRRRSAGTGRLVDIMLADHLAND